MKNFIKIFPIFCFAFILIKVTTISAQTYPTSFGSGSFGTTGSSSSLLNPGSGGTTCLDGTPIGSFSKTTGSLCGIGSSDQATLLSNSPDSTSTTPSAGTGSCAPGTAGCSQAASTQTQTTSNTTHTGGPNGDGTCNYQENEGDTPTVVADGDTMPNSDYGKNGKSVCMNGSTTMQKGNNSNSGAADGDSGKTNSTGTQACQDSLQKAQQTCSASTSIQMMQQASMQAQMVMSMNSAGNAGAMCNAAATMGALQAAYTGYSGVSCGEAVGDCKSACAAPSQGDTTNTVGLNRCTALHAQAVGMDLQAGITAAMALLAKKCANNYAGTAAALPVTLGPQICSDPTYYAAHAQDCYCALNPGNSQCALNGMPTQPAPIAKIGNTGGGGAGTAANPNGSANMDGNNPFGNGGTGNNAANPNSQSGGGTPFGPSGGGAGPLAADSQDGTGGAGSPNGGSIFGGFSGGLGGGGSGGFGRVGSEDKANGGLMKALASKFNINGLSPFGRDPKRGLANVVGKDGVTPANGLSIWEKVSRRYKIKEKDLLPP